MLTSNQVKVHPEVVNNYVNNVYNYIKENYREEDLMALVKNVNDELIRDAVDIIVQLDAYSLDRKDGTRNYKVFHSLVIRHVAANDKALGMQYKNSYDDLSKRIEDYNNLLVAAKSQVEIDRIQSLLNSLNEDLSKLHLPYLARLMTKSVIMDSAIKAGPDGKELTKELVLKEVQDAMGRIK